MPLPPLKIVMLAWLVGHIYHIVCSYSLFVIDRPSISQESDADDDEADNEAIVGVSPVKRVHPSSKNPLHGVVEGAKQGNEIYRTCDLHFASGLVLSF